MEYADSPEGQAHREQDERDEYERDQDRQHFLDELAELCHRHKVSIEIDWFTWVEANCLQELPAFCGPVDAAGFGWLADMKAVEDALETYANEPTEEQEVPDGT